MNPVTRNRLARSIQVHAMAQNLDEEASCEKDACVPYKTSSPYSSAEPGKDSTLRKPLAVILWFLSRSTCKSGRSRAAEAKDDEIVIGKHVQCLKHVDLVFVPAHIPSDTIEGFSKVRWGSDAEVSVFHALCKARGPRPISPVGWTCRLLLNIRPGTNHW